MRGGASGEETQHDRRGEADEGSEPERASRHTRVAGLNGAADRKRKISEHGSLYRFIISICRMVVCMRVTNEKEDKGKKRPSSRERRFSFCNGRKRKKEKEEKGGYEN